MTGTIIYNPKITATGKNRRAIVRKFAHEIYLELISKNDKFVYLTDGRRDHYQRRSNGACSEESLEELLKIAYSYNLSSISRLQSALYVKSPKDRENWCIVKFSQDQIKEKLIELRSQGIKISGSAWGPHISIIRGEQVNVPWGEIKANQTIDVTLGEMKTNGEYYWYNIACLELEQIRIKHGLSPRPSPNFHLTIGKATP